MTDEARAPQIAAADAYEERLVPALFEEWGPRVVTAADLKAGDRVLDVGCGTGVLARAAALAVGAGGAVTGVDPNPGMLAVAKRLAPDITWRIGPAESLPFPDASFDAVVSQFALMFFADREKAIREMLRVLVPGGRLAVAVWDSLDNTPAYATEVEMLQRTAGEAAADAMRAPFVLGDRATLTSLFAAAGLPTVDITSHVGSGRYPSIRAMVEPDVFGWLPIMGVNLTEEEADRVFEAAEVDLSPFTTVGGRVEFESPAHIVTATKP